MTPEVESRQVAALGLSCQGFAISQAYGVSEGVCGCGQSTCNAPGKHGGTGWLERATTDPATIATRFARGDPNYGVVPPVGTGLLIVDEDVPHALDALGPLPHTLIVQTGMKADGSRGRHVYGRLPAGIAESEVPYLWAGGEVRIAANGHAIGPYSRHRSGILYQPLNGSMMVNDLDEAWVRALIASGRVKHTDQTEARTQADPGWFIEVGRHNWLLARGVVMREHGIVGDVLFDQLTQLDRRRCRPPLSDTPNRGPDELRSIVAWLMGHVPDGEPGSVPPDPQDAETAAADTTPAWPEPPAPVAYRGILGELVDAVGESTEADPVALLGTFITMFGAACGHWRTVHHGDWQAGNVFTILVGESGEAGRKGTSLATARDIFRAAYPPLDDFWAPGLGSGEGLVGFLKRRQPDPDDKFRKVEHRMLLVESEFGRLLRVIAREGSTVSQLMREAYDGVPIGRLLAREDDIIPWHHVSLIGHITPGELRGSLAAVDKSNGFVNRGLWLCVRRARIVSTTVPAAPLAAPYVKALHQAIVEAQAPAVLDLTDDAKGWWGSYRLTAAASRQGGLADALTARSATHIARVALIYVMADRATMVGVEHLDAARALVEYGERSVRHVFGESTGNRHADVLWRVLRETGAIPWEDVKAETGLSLAADREDAVAALVEYGIAEIVKVPRPGGGRPRRVIRRRGANGTNGTN